jgi:hypothetical protein
VLLCLVKASTRLERVQAAFLEQLAVSLHCADALDLLAPLCLRLVTKERLGTMEVSPPRPYVQFSLVFNFFSTYHPDTDPDDDFNSMRMRIRIRLFSLMRIQILACK